MDGCIVIKKATSDVMYLCGEQLYSSSETYRISDFVISHELSDGTLFLSCLTGELIKVIDYNMAFPYLVKHWFFVRLNTDEKLLVPKIRHLLDAYEKTRKHRRVHFEILTTMECNANCFYCYEKGYHISSMKPETAQQVVQFIKAGKPNNIVKIQWYGGEPLMNSNSIDIICDGLKCQNIEFVSSMVSNGFLFSDDIILKANNLWNLKTVRISLDGEEKTYNKTKSYKHVSGSPFRIVLSNIDKLIRANISVGLRVNIENYNIKSCLSLVDFLATKYKGNKKVSFFINLLNNTERNDKIASDKDARLFLFDEVVRIKERLFREGFDVNFISIPSMSAVFCPADDKSHVLIKPNGDLAFCAENFDNIANGTVFSCPAEIQVPSLFSETYQMGPACDNCPMFASCTLSKLCPSCSQSCTAEIKEIKLRELKLAMEKQYYNYIETNK